jgi:chitodextrinase
MLLTGLSPATTYHFRAKSTDPSGNGPSASEISTFTTLFVPDLVPPRISNVTVTGITDSLAIVSWMTDKQSTSAVEFGLALPYARMVSSDAFSLIHSAVLPGLQPGTSYHFRVSAKDMAGNGPAYSPDATFTTTTQKDTKAPTILESKVVSVGKDSVTLSITLDEPSSIVIEYGTSSKGYGKSVIPPLYLSNHKVTLSGLAPGTTYHYRISATDPSGNGPARSTDHTFRTKDAATKPSGLSVSENGPMLLLAIVLIAGAISGGLYFMTRKPAPPPASPAPPAAAVREQPVRRTVPRPPPEYALSSPGAFHAGRPAPAPPAPVRKARPAQDAAPQATAGDEDRITVVQKVSVDDFEDEGDVAPKTAAPAAAEPVIARPRRHRTVSQAEPESEKLPQAPTTAAARGQFSENEILKALSSLPRGLPSSLSGMDMDALAATVAKAEYRENSEGDLLVKVRNKWYYGDPRDVGNYLQNYKGK